MSGPPRSPPERENWHAMISRCTNPKHPHFARYAGRGITICAEWLASFEAFYRDVGPRPSKRHTIDRIDNDGNYEPGNVRWATWKEQLRNRGDHNHMVTAFGRTLNLSAWAEETGLGVTTLRKRLLSGWSPEDAISKPIAVNKSHRRVA